ncbi:EmrB/QacA subfamily drug resistance transporter [Pseudoduganella flava]|uniref:EmrB/QacA subfamily drug resistance transporter n=1 Tax=Pseudoduganella flava TaxID=871742 RepID=A0A562PQR7_9BURK|nr:MFS transporter [Pseudoduganella flava]QGZ37951.1 MFS transporter [Pseudoduganella flava]TWI46791.1 EmrB/QacA subfamily drug resistance transporter [Pseudoduganella flava]
MSDTPAERRARAVPWLVACAFFMENLDATAITTSLPQMAASFGTRPEHLSIGLSAYLVALAAFIPASGWLADRYGPRRVFAAAIGVFTFASVLCALAPSLAAFTAARVLQGMGGALMVPVGRLVVLRNTPKEHLVRAIATVTWPGLAAPIIGPALGGFITATWSWHWIFLVNVPLAAALLVAAWWIIPSAGAAPRPFDLPGFAGSGAACTLLMVGVELPGHGQWMAAGLTLLAGAALLWWSARHFRRVAAPLLDLRPLAIRTFAVTVRGGSLARIAIGSAPFLVPLMLQLAFGLPGTTAGMLLLALFAGNLAMKPRTSWAMRRFGLRNVLVGNGMLLAVGFWLCALLRVDTPLPAVAAVLFFCGASRSMQFTALNTIAFANVPPPQMSGASTLFSVLAQVNAGLGIAAGALLLKVAELAGWGHEPAAFRFALGAMGLVALAGVVDSLRLPADAGAQVVGR